MAAALDGFLAVLVILTLVGSGSVWLNLAVSVQPAQDLIDHGQKQVLIGAGCHVPLGPGMRRPAGDDGETVHQAAHCLSETFFPGRPLCLDTQVSRMHGPMPPAPGLTAADRPDQVTAKPGWAFLHSLLIII